MDKRFEPGNRPAKAVVTENKTGKICAQVKILHESGRTDNPVFRLHIARCDECRRKYSQ
ncbi:MAG: hypothetical protein UT28_C0001G0368 [Berkelbacteria bacterium GW2011_GWE1_39_12]|uniref:Uncharacterized protein n=1 Tax=Berkelbacteria bacterium GW2011_GWE1_39_12 TaxID=1618337 RepID=A0A0G4B590_9BACT|nr:MAG: hypothetical protein UT28_C0001G0368 [Berkelbacteria bacterium GW2011_GWE1_39_12]